MISLSFFVFSEQADLNSRVGEEGFNDDTNVHSELIGNTPGEAHIVKAENSGAIEEGAGGGEASNSGEIVESGAVIETGELSKDDVYFDMESSRSEDNGKESVDREGCQRNRHTELERLGGVIVDTTLRSRTVRKP